MQWLSKPNEAGDWFYRDPTTEPGRFHLLLVIVGRSGGGAVGTDDAKKGLWFGPVPSVKTKQQEWEETRITMTGKDSLTQLQLLNQFLEMYPPTSEEVQAMFRGCSASFPVQTIRECDILGMGVLPNEPNVAESEKRK